jgi:hypothetical protein
MKKIALNSKSNIERFALVDDEDYAQLSTMKWSYDHGYAVNSKYAGGGRKNQKNIKTYMHRFLCPNYEIVDHIDRNRLNNQKANLREANIFLNNQNIGLSSKNTSGHRGIVWDKLTNKWRSSLQLNGKVYWLGRHATKENAILARKNKLMQLSV